MTHENNQLWTKTYSGLLALKSITSGQCYATIYTSGFFNRVDVTVFRTAEDLIDYVIVMKTLYLDKDIKEDVEEIESKIDKALLEVLNG